MRINAERKRSQPAEAVPGSVSRLGVTAGRRIPNSAMASLLGGSSSGYANPDLEHRMNARLAAVPHRPQAQIPQAEQEADRLSAAVHAGTPESVKAMMGQRMGADFSQVRFHTGAAAAAKADAMGARAYTSGADVYFGSGGFDPSVAAHELVHTAQQGMVDSGISVMSTPVGGVQMMPNPLKWLWDKTGGRAIRKHHDAMDELHEAVRSGDWGQLSPEEQKAFRKKNLMAYKRYMGSEKVRSQTAARVDRRAQERAAAAAFLSANRTGSSSMLTSDAGGNMRIGYGVADRAQEAVTEKDNLDRAGDIAGAVDNATVIPGIASGFQEAEWIGNVGGNGLDGTLAAANVGTGIVDAIQAGKDLRDAFREGGRMDRLDASVDLGSSLAKTGGGMAGIANAMGYEAAGNWAAGADIVTGSADVYKGARQIHQGRRKHNAMAAFQQAHYGNQTRDRLAANDLLLRDIATQGKMEGTRQKIKGTGKVVTGAMDAVAGIAELSGVSSSVGAGLQVGNTALKAGFAAANSRQKDRMVKKVMAQTGNLTDETIREFQRANGIRSFSRAKQALMKEMGYESGQRAELYADQMEKRGQYLADQANSGTADEKVKQLVAGLGVKQTGNGSYDADDITKSLGHWKSRADIAKGHNTLKKLAQRRRLAGAGGTP